MRGFGSRLRAVIRLRGKTITRVAEDLGVTRPAVQFWLSETTVPGLHLFVDVARSLDVSTDYLLFGVVGKELSAKEKRQIAKLIRLQNMR